MDKQDLRQEYKAIRVIMDPEEVAAKSGAICRKLMSEVDWNKVKNLCAFYPIPNLNEADIRPLIKNLEDRFPAINIHVVGQNRDFEIPSTKFDVILAPALAFDKENFRLGWGGGWYDRFLAGQPRALKIGVCYQNGFCGSGLPREPHDIPLDIVVTEV